MSLQKPGLGSTYVTRVEIGPLGSGRKPREVPLLLLGRFHLSGEKKKQPNFQ